jgi:hypothetical protein
MPKQPKKIQFDGAEKEDNKVNKDGKISQVSVSYTSEHWVKMEIYATITIAAA